MDILRSTTGVKLLVTSRERLNLQDEWAYDLHGLPIPTVNDAACTEENSAVQLFVRSAQRIRTSFSVTDENRLAIARICQLVEGMPLGIELAAAWVRTLSCREIAKEIERNLDFLASSARDRPERHQSMRAVFDHSWHLLTADEQWTLRQLSVFRGGFERLAAQQIAGATLHVLSALTDKSLLSRTGEDRFELHELVRQYAALKLSEAHEETATRQRHFDYYQSLAEIAAINLMTAEQEKWLNRLEAEHGNLRAALGWSQSQSGSSEAMLLLAGALYLFWSHRGYLQEGRAWLEGALARANDSEVSFAFARALFGAGSLILEEGDLQTARALLEKSVTYWRTIGSHSTSGLAHALIILAGLVRDLGELVLAHSLAAESVALFKEISNRWGLAHTLHSYSLVALRRGDYEATRALSIEALPLMQRFGHKQRIGYILNTLGVALINLGEFEAAQPYFELAQTMFYEIGDKYGIANALQNNGYLALMAGKDAEVQALFDQGLPLAREAGPKWISPLYLARYASLAGLRGKPVEALHLWAAAEELMTVYSSYMDASDRYLYEQTIAPALLALDEATIQAARVGGRLMSLEQAIDYAKHVVGSRV